jgi:hypothetical protein
MESMIVQREAERDWLGALLLVNRSDRPDWFFNHLHHRRSFTREEAQSLLLDVWSDAEYPSDWRREFEYAFRLLGYCTDSSSPLPQGDVEIYRGQGRYETLGLSWTLEYERALWFAKRKTSSGNRAVVSGVIAHEHVYAYVTGRGEAEVVVNPRRVRKKRWESVAVLIEGDPMKDRVF